MTSPDDLSIERFIAGDASPGERRVVEAWLREHPSRAAQVALLRAQMDDVHTFDAHRGWQQLAPRLARQRWAATRPILWAAAATLVLWFGWQGWSSREQQLAAAPGTSPSVTLADGSTVRLAPGSSMVWRARRGRERYVRLTGEAWFEVAHAATPFRVYARHAVIEDIGTRFAVDARDTLGDVAVAVEEGEVSLATAAGDTTHAVHRLVAGQVARIDQTGHVASLNDSDARLAWVRGTFVWRDVALPAVAADLERWFGIVVEVDDSLSTLRLTARYTHQAGVAAILEGIALTFGARVSNMGTRWTLTRRGR